MLYRKTPAFFRALHDEKYESLNTVLICDRQRDGSAPKINYIAARATSYHAMQIHGKVAAKEIRAGQDENDEGSIESALNTTAREEPRNSRRNLGQKQKRKRTSWKW